MLGIVKSIGDEREERRGVALHAIYHVGIACSEGTMTYLDILCHPLVGDDIIIGTGGSLVHAAPFGIAVAAGTDDVEQRRKFLRIQMPLSSWSEMV